MNARLDSSLIHFLADGPKAPGKGVSAQNLSSSATSFAAFMKELPTPTKSLPTTTIASKLIPNKPLVNLAPKTETSAESTQNTEARPEPDHSEIEEISADAIATEIVASTEEQDIGSYIHENEAQPLAVIVNPAEQKELEEVEAIEETRVDFEEDDTREERSEESISPQAVALDARHEALSLQTISTIEEDFNRLDAEAADLEIKEAPASAISQDTSLKPNIEIKENKAESTEITRDSDPQEVNIEIDSEAVETKLSELQEKGQAIQTNTEKAKEPTSAVEASKAAPIQNTKPSVENAQPENPQIAQNVKPVELDTEHNTDLMSDGEAEAGTKFDVKVESENKHTEPRSIFTSASAESTASKPLGTTSGSDIPPATKQIFSQVQDHVKSIFTNHNISKGESTTTINLDPGNLGQISVQIISGKDGDTQIKLIVSKEATHEMIRESWDVFVKENLEKVSSADNTSLSFSLERGDREDARQQQQDMWNFHFENADSDRSQSPSSKASYGIAETAAIQVSRLDLEAGHANIML